MDTLTIFMIILVAMVVFGIVSGYMICRENKRLSDRLEQNKWKRSRSSSVNVVLSGSPTNAQGQHVMDFNSIHGIEPTPRSYQPSMGGQVREVAGTNVMVVDPASRNFQPAMNGYNTDVHANRSRDTSVTIDRHPSPIPEHHEPSKEERIQPEVSTALPLTSHSPEERGRRPSPTAEEQAEKSRIVEEMFVVVPSTSDTTQATGHKSVMVDHDRLSGKNNHSDDEGNSGYEPHLLPAIRGHPPPPPAEYLLEK